MATCSQVFLNRTTNLLKLSSTTSIGDINEISQEVEVIERIFCQMESTTILRRGYLNIHRIKALLLYVNSIFHPLTILSSGCTEFVTRLDNSGAYLII